MCTGLAIRLARAGQRTDDNVPLQNYAQDCLNTFNCQQQNVNIDSSSSIGIYMLSTVASQYMLSMNGQGIVPNSANRNGFAQTLTSWTRS